MENKQLNIDVALVRSLVATQFPKWKDLPIRPVIPGGWDNRTFHLGENMLVRMPSAAGYAAQVEKEHKWLPRLAPHLPLSIPVPLEMGNPDKGYQWKWSIYRWLEGDTVASTPIDNLSEFAVSLAQFLVALQKTDTTGGPLPSLHSFYRGGSLSVYDDDTRRAIDQLEGRIDVEVALNVWETALATSWNPPPVWVHGDISVGNLLAEGRRLCAVIDFGQLTVGDPACDLVMNWTLFQGKSRDSFREALPLDAGTWARACGWALWKALVTAAGFTNPNNAESKQCWRIIDEVLADHKRSV
jgi:aminoglycoside phosphotransferase (APT) family kinase protein